MTDAEWEKVVERAAKGIADLYDRWRSEDGDSPPDAVIAEAVLARLGIRELIEAAETALHICGDLGAQRRYERIAHVLSAALAKVKGDSQ